MRRPWSVRCRRGGICTQLWDAQAQSRRHCCGFETLSPGPTPCRWATYNVMHTLVLIYSLNQYSPSSEPCFVGVVGNRIRVKTNQLPLVRLSSFNITCNQYHAPASCHLQRWLTADSHSAPYDRDHEVSQCQTRSRLLSLPHDAGRPRGGVQTEVNLRGSSHALLGGRSIDNRRIKHDSSWRLRCGAFHPESTS